MGSLIKSYKSIFICMIFDIGNFAGHLKSKGEKNHEVNKYL